MKFTTVGKQSQLCLQAFDDVFDIRHMLFPSFKVAISSTVPILGESNHPTLGESNHQLF